MPNILTYFTGCRQGAPSIHIPCPPDANNGHYGRKWWNNKVVHAEMVDDLVLSNRVSSLRNLLDW